jgi:hypothetical protein
MNRIVFNENCHLVCLMDSRNRLKNLKLLIVAAGLAAIGGLYGVNAVYANHSFEAGVAANSLPQNTHVRLDGLTLPPGGVLPIYDASPNFVAGHFLLRAPCDSNHVPTITVMAGHIDEMKDHTYVDKVPLFYISYASTAGSCVWHAHVPDPLNGGPSKVTDIDLINLSGSPITFNPGDAADMNVQRVLGSINDSPYSAIQLPGDLTHGNRVLDLNDNSTANDGFGAQ